MIKSVLSDTTFFVDNPVDKSVDKLLRKKLSTSYPQGYPQVIHILHRYYIL